MTTNSSLKGHPKTSQTSTPQMASITEAPVSPDGSVAFEYDMDSPPQSAKDAVASQRSANSLVGSARSLDSASSGRSKVRDTVNSPLSSGSVYSQYSAGTENGGSEGSVVGADDGTPTSATSVSRRKRARGGKRGMEISSPTTPASTTSTPVSATSEPRSQEDRRSTPRTRGQELTRIVSLCEYLLLACDIPLISLQTYSPQPSYCRLPSCSL
jgi:hypothetical protein